MNVAVLGLGKLGLPLAVHYAGAGHEVVGIDIDAGLVRSVSLGESLLPNEAGLHARMKLALSDQKLRATTDPNEGIRHADVVVLTLPLSVTPTGEPDFSALIAGCSAVGAAVKGGALVVVETTLPIGALRGILKPAIEAPRRRVEGKDFHLVHSPERVLTGRVSEDLAKYPKLVGAFDNLGFMAAKRFFDSVIDFSPRKDLKKPNGVWDLGSPEAAEFAKLAETTYRDVNIALANQFATHAMNFGVDVFDVIEACNSQPYSHIHHPGISVGGHCIPVYPHLYMNSDSRAGVVSVSRAENEDMPRKVTSSFVDLLDQQDFSDGVLLVLGVAYRPNVKETANSGAFPIAEVLADHGIAARFCDPLYSSEEIEQLGLVALDPKDRIRAIILHTAHDQFLDLTTRDFPDVRAIYDGRHFLKRANWPGVSFSALGVPAS